MKTIMTLVAGVCVGAICAVGTYQLGIMGESSGSMASGGDEDAPLYWVAPMDPNYRRDAPGKSPMGMDLIPVYAKDQVGGDSPGLISIAPEIVNNLGVKRADVVMGALKPEIRSVGYLQYDQTRIEHIHPRVEGWIEKSYAIRPAYRIGGCGIHLRGRGTAGLLIELVGPIRIHAEGEGEAQLRGAADLTDHCGALVS